MNSVTVNVKSEQTSTEKSMDQSSWQFFGSTESLGKRYVAVKFYKGFIKVSKTCFLGNQPGEHELRA